MNRFTVHLDLSGVGRMDTGQRLDERTLARAIGPKQRMDLAGAHEQIDRGECHHRAIRLGDISGGKQWLGIVHQYGWNSVKRFCHR